MKMGVRKVNLQSRVKSRTSGKVTRAVKKSVNPVYGKKGVGVVTDPQKAVYNKIYNKTTTSVNSISEIDKNPVSSSKSEHSQILFSGQDNIDLNKLFKNAPKEFDPIYKSNQPAIKKDYDKLSSRDLRIGLIILILSLIIYFVVPPVGFIGVVTSIVFLAKSRKYKKLDQK